MQQLADIEQAARTTWAPGDDDAMMRQEGLYEVGRRIVGHLGIGPGDRVLDVACGTGKAAIPAAQAGAAVVGVDLIPALLDVARRRFFREHREIGHDSNAAAADCHRGPSDRWSKPAPSPRPTVRTKDHRTPDTKEPR